MAAYETESLPEFPAILPVLIEALDARFPAPVLNSWSEIPDNETERLNLVFRAGRAAVVEFLREVRADQQENHE